MCVSYMENDTLLIKEEEFEDTKRVIRIRISKKDRQHKAQKKMDKQRSTKHTRKTKDRLTRARLKTGSELVCSGGVSSSCSTSGTRRVRSGHCMSITRHNIHTLSIISSFTYSKQEQPEHLFIDPSKCHLFS